MDSKALESLMIPEENFEIANEGVGAEIAKLAGKGILKILKHLAILLGISIGTSALLIGSNVAAQKKAANKRQNLTDDEKKSKSNYINTWKPELMKFNKMIIDDINEVDKKCDIKKYLSVPKSGPSSYGTFNGETIESYDWVLVYLNWTNLQYPGADGDDEADPEKLKDLVSKLENLKPYINKWKTAAKKFEPYFKLEIEIDEIEDDIENGLYEFTICLNCKWIDKYNVLKPGLPELK